MKYLLTLLFAALLSTCVNAQVNIIFDNDNTETIDGEEINIIVSDTASIAAAAATESQRAAARYARLIQRINAENWERIDRLISGAANDYNIDLDSIQNARWTYLVDTMTMRVKTTDLTAAEIAEYTDVTDPDDIIIIDVRGFYNSLGRLVIRPVGGGSGNWRVFMKGSNLFEVRGMPGVTNFYLERETDTRRVFRDDGIGAPTVRIITKR